MALIKKASESESDNEYEIASDEIGFACQLDLDFDHSIRPFILTPYSSELQIAHEI